jgi:hypothetical protein
MNRHICLAAAVVFILSCPHSGRPNAPVLTGPSAGQKDVPVALTLRAEDPQNEDVCYKVSWGDGTVDDWGDFVHSGVGISLAHAFQRIDEFQVLARAKDLDGVESDWSEPFSILVSPRAPMPPLAPEGPVTGVPGRILAFTASAVDPDGDSVALRFDWGDTTVSGWSGLVENGVVVANSHAYSDTGSFGIRAQAKNAGGDTSAWSEPAALVVLATEWQTVMSEGFEFSFPGSGWALSGETTWGRDTFRHNQGSASGWCAGSRLAAPGPYPNNMNARMTYGPFSLEDADSANLAFDRYLKSEQSHDYFTWGVSVDSLNFHGRAVSGDSASWVRESIDLGNVPGLGNVCGESKIWIVFGFASNDSVTDEGAYVDNILLRRHRAGVVPRYAAFLPGGRAGLRFGPPKEMPR